MTQTASDQSADHFETLCGMTLAILAAVLAVNDLGAGKFGDDEILAHNDKNGAYLWYQAKGIKETQIEGQKLAIETMMTGGLVDASREESAKQLVQALDKKLARYKKEKNEILLGSEAVGREHWAQEVDGEMGKVIGATVLEAAAQQLGRAGDVFDYATLFLQLCLVMGAIAIVVRQRRLKWMFYSVMVCLGGIGTICSVVAYSVALR